MPKINVLDRMYLRSHFPYDISYDLQEKQKNTQFKTAPCISVIVTFSVPDPDALELLLDSMEKQTYENWEVIITDAYSEAADPDHFIDEDRVKHIIKSYKGREWSLKKSRIRYYLLSEDQGFALNANNAIGLASGEYIAVLEQYDFLHPSALFEAVKYIDHFGADFIYTDSCKFTIEKNGIQVTEPCLKPEFSTETLRSTDYISRMVFFSRGLIKENSCFDPESGTAAYTDLIYRISENAACIKHIPLPLVFTRSEKETRADRDDAMAALGRHLSRTGIEYTEIQAYDQHSMTMRPLYTIPTAVRILVVCENQNVYDLVEKELGVTRNIVRISCMYRDAASGLDYMKIGQNRQKKSRRSPDTDPASFNTVDLSKALQEEVKEITDEDRFGSPMSDTTELLSYGSLRLDDLKVIDGCISAPAEKVLNDPDADVIIFVRDGYVPEFSGDNWLVELTDVLVPPENMTAGSITVNEKCKITHAGYYYDDDAPKAVRLKYQGAPDSYAGYLNMLDYRHNVSLLGGAAFAVKGLFLREYLGERKEEIQELLKTEGDQAGIYFPDLFSTYSWFDMCLKALAEKSFNVLTPFASFIGRNGADKNDMTDEEVQRLRMKWGRALHGRDPFLSHKLKKNAKFLKLWKD